MLCINCISRGVKCRMINGARNKPINGTYYGRGQDPTLVEAVLLDTSNAAPDLQ